MLPESNKKFSSFFFVPVKKKKAKKEGELGVLGKNYLAEWKEEKCIEPKGFGADLGRERTFRQFIALY